MLAATVVYVLRWSRFNDIGRPREGPVFLARLACSRKKTAASSGRCPIASD